MRKEWGDFTPHIVSVDGSMNRALTASERQLTGRARGRPTRSDPYRIEAPKPPRPPTAEQLEIKQRILESRLKISRRWSRHQYARVRTSPGFSPPAEQSEAAP